MKFTFQYRTSEERESLIASKSDLILIEEQNLVSGNFLVFSDMSIEEEELIRNNAVEKIGNLENRTKATEDALLAIMMNGGI